MKDILILNGAARKNGNTKKLVDAFVRGATAADRLYAELRCLGYGGFPREGVLLMTAGGSDYSQAVSWYRHYSTNLGWKNLGEVLGANKSSSAEKLGASIK